MGQKFESETPEIGGQPENGNIEEIADSLLESAPGVSQHVIDKEIVEQEEKLQNVDKSGTVFDPAIHAADENGEPIMTAAGNYRRKSGRKAGSQGSGAESTRKTVNSQLGSGLNASKVPPPPSVDAGTLAAGTATAALIFQVGQLVGGDEWAPIVNPEIGLNEPETMRAAWVDYYKVKGVTDFPPGVALAITMAAYALPRFAAPKTKSRIAKAWGWVKSKISKRGKEKAPEKTEKKGE